MQDKSVSVRSFLLWEYASRDTMDLKRCYIDLCGGDILEGLVLSEIIYWHLPAKDGTAKLRVEHESRMWIAVRRYEWWERARISPRQADRILESLEKSNLITKRVFKFNGDPTTHIALNWDAFLHQLEYWLNNPPKNPFLSEVDSVITPAVRTEVHFVEVPVTETTSETNQDKRVPESIPAIIKVNRNAVGIDPKDTLEKITVGSDSFPPVGHDVIHILQTQTTNGATTLTANQVALLTKDVNVPGVGATFSPNAMRTAHPKQWETFIEHVSDMPAWHKRFVEGKERITAGKIIDFIRGYHWQGGWFDYLAQPNALPTKDFSNPLNDLEQWSTE